MCLGSQTHTHAYTYKCSMYVCVKTYERKEEINLKERKGIIEKDKKEKKGGKWYNYTLKK